ncbi:MAG: hypothetical protein IBJ03_02760 [Gemmatimonadaceae bacterium]|nr:hypothetical protein [Gemmatimonadaceae bacterium]
MFRTATLTVVGAIALAASGPPHMTVKAVNATDGTTLAKLAVHVEHHVEPEKLTVTARAESRRGTTDNAQRVVRTMPVNRSANEEFFVPVNLDKGTPWVVIVTAMQGTDGAHGIVEAVISVSPTGALQRMEYTKPGFTLGKPNRVGDAEIKAALDAIKP